MAITAVNAVGELTAPTKTGQIIIQKPYDDKSVYKGFAQASLDGTSTSFYVNFIDGTQKLSFAPIAVIAVRALPPTNLTSVATSTAYTYGTQVLDTNSGVILCIQAGTSASSAPTYSTTVGGTTTDGSVVWQLLTKADTAAATIYVASTSVYDATKFLVTISAAGSNGNLLSLAFIALKGF